MRCPPLVSVPWLSSRLSSVLVVDASWYLPAMGRNGRDEFETKRIPGARFFDVDATDDTSSLPHMLPSDAYFSDTMSRLGISKADHVVCYDAKGIFSSARLWWMLRAYGHEQASDALHTTSHNHTLFHSTSLTHHPSYSRAGVSRITYHLSHTTRSYIAHLLHTAPLHQASVLDGGLPAWERAGEPVLRGAPTAAASADSYQGTLRSELVCSRQRMCDLVAQISERPPLPPPLPPPPRVIDARSQARFEGTVAEARKGCRSGHIPGSRSLPFDRTLAEDGTMLPVEKLEPLFAEAGVENINAPLIGTCGSGVTASVLALALAHMGREQLLEIYDGAWAEWGGDQSLPLATGPPTG